MSDAAASMNTALSTSQPVSRRYKGRCANCSRFAVRGETLCGKHLALKDQPAPEPQTTKPPSLRMLRRDLEDLYEGPHTVDDVFELVRAHIRMARKEAA